MLEAGEQAPFSGDLFSPDASIHLAQSKDHCGDKIRIEVSKTSSIAEEDKKLMRKHFDADLNKATAGLKAERDFYKQQTDRPWYEHPAFLIPVTAIAAGAIVTVLYMETEIGRKIGSAIRD